MVVRRAAVSLSARSASGESIGISWSAGMTCMCSGRRAPVGHEVRVDMWRIDFCRQPFAFSHDPGEQRTQPQDIDATQQVFLGRRLEWYELFLDRFIRERAAGCD